MSKLAGREIQSSAKIESLINELVKETTAFEKTITTVRDPAPELADHAKKLFDETGKYRGRPLFYSFVGTGAGRGPYVEVEDGSVKLDLVNGIGVHIFGHGHPELRAATIRGALSDVIMQGNLEPNVEYSRLGKMIVDLASKKSRLKHVWLTTCGTMANENALKMARQKNSPAKLISR